MSGEQEELQFNVGDGEEETTVVMNADGGNATVLKKEEVEGALPPGQLAGRKDGAPDDEELEEYSQNVQKRINKLTARLREHQRREEAALEFARSVQRTNEELQERYKQSDVARMGEARGRLDTQILALKNVIKRAREENDIDTETEAQQRLTTALWEQQKLLDTERQAKEQPVVVPQVPIRQEQPAPKQVDPRAEEWAEKNPWFGKDVVMTNTVRGIHVELVRNEGFDPTSEEYYDEIDRRMRSLFPQRFQGRQEQREEPAPQNNRGTRPASTVAPASRPSGVNSTATARRMIRLKPSEVAIAKKLGVPLEEYAKYVKR